ncbi:MAG: hypothetical protein ACLP1Y_10345 [Candidatus Acidiferrales bacterium]
MSEDREEVVQGSGTHARWVGPAVVLAGIVALAGLGVGWSASSHATQTQISLENEIKTLKLDYSSQIAQLQQHQSQIDVLNSELRSNLGVITGKLRITQGQLDKARDQEVQDTQTNQEQLTLVNENVQGELADKANSDDVKAVDTRVAGVRTDLDTTRNDLQMTRSELGTLIAKNHEEVEELRRMGERDYIEFTVTGRNKPAKVGDFMVTLKGTNPNKKQFTVDLLVDDVHIGRKNLAINDPIFFHEGSTRQPLEFVVNQVKPDEIIGYISVPKSAAPTTSASAASGR